MDYFNRLPVDITLDILARLPTDSVLDSKLVCTRWRNVVSNHPSFSKMHLHHHLNHPSSAANPQDYCKLGFLALTVAINFGPVSFYYFEHNEKNYDDDDEEEKSTKSIQSIKRIKFTSPFACTSLVGSCNGLICVTNRPYPSRLCIFNPITREYVLLPEIETKPFSACGFGYVSSSNEYKVLVSFLMKTNVDVHIYTLGSRSGWRKPTGLIGNINFHFGGIVTGVLVKEALYWMNVKSERNITFDLVAFDLVEEKFCEHLAPPPLPLNNDWYSNDIGVLNGLLFIALDDGQYNEVYDVWLSKKKKPNHDKEEAEEHQSLCWTKEFRIDTMDLLAITKSGGVFTYDNNYLNIYNTKTSTSKSLVKFKNLIKRVIPHENTLVSLKELGEEDTKVMEAVEETKIRDQLREDTEHEYIHL